MKVVEIILFLVIAAMANFFLLALSGHPVLGAIMVTPPDVIGMYFIWQSVTREEGQK